MQTVVCDNAAKAVAGYVSYMKRFGFNQGQLINSKNSMLTYLRGFISKEVAAKRDNKPEWRTCYWRDGYTPMTWCFTLYLLPQQKLVAIMAFTYKENKPGVKESRNTVRLTESELKEIIAESVKTVLKEMEEKTVEEYTVINGCSWTSYPHGLESKGGVIKIRMYDRNREECKNNFETYGLFRRVDNLKFFYAKIVPIENTKETKWVAVPRNKLPKAILDDFKTINPLEHEPFLPF